MGRAMVAVQAFYPSARGPIPLRSTFRYRAALRRFLRFGSSVMGGVLSSRWTTALKGMVSRGAAFFSSLIRELADGLGHGDIPVRADGRQFFPFDTFGTTTRDECAAFVHHHEE